MAPARKADHPEPHDHQRPGGGFGYDDVGPTRRLLTSQVPALAVTPLGNTKTSMPNGIAKLLLKQIGVEAGQAKKTDRRGR